jgi:MFS transporter, FHS family, L-fucose permease
MNDQAAASNAGQSSVPRNTGFALAVLSAVFFSFGFVTAFKDSLVPHLQSIFTLSQSSADLIQFFFFLAFGLLSLPSTVVVAKMGHHKAIAVGLAVMALGALLVPPGAILLSYPVFLVALWVISAGVTLIQVAANPFATLLGKPETAAARLAMVETFNSLGTFVAPALGGILILTNNVNEGVKTTAERLAMASTVKLPYLGLGLVFLLLAFAVALCKMPQPPRETATGGAWGDVWKHPHLLLGIVCLFVYVGAEVTIGGHLIKYVNLVAGIALKKAAFYASLYWGGAMVGRFLGTAILSKFSGGKVLGVGAAMAFALVAATIATTGMVAVWSAVLVGLFNSIMFPAAFSLAVHQLGPLTGKASGLLHTAIFGGAVIPLVQGKVIDLVGSDAAAYHISFVVPALCYLFIMFYGFRGSRVKAAA